MSKQTLDEFEEYLGSFRPMTAPPLQRRRTGRRAAWIAVCIALLAALALVFWPPPSRRTPQPQTPPLRVAEPTPEPQPSPEPRALAPKPTRHPTFLALRVRAGDTEDLLNCLDSPPQELTMDGRITLPRLWQLLKEAGEIP